MKKTTAQKSAKQPQGGFNCPQCGKTFQTAQGLSGHVRYLHPEPKRPSSMPQPRIKQQTKAEAPVLIASTGAHEHLQAAFAVLREREREIEAEIARLETLKPQREIIQRELEAVKAALDVFGGRESSTKGNVGVEQAEGSAALDTQETLGAEEDSLQGEGTEILEAVVVPESTADDRNSQRTVVRRANVSRNGKSRGADVNAPEFTGNKTEFVRAVVRARGSEGTTPKDIDQVFAKRRIERSKNAIYNALDSLVRQKKLRKHEGHYFYLESAKD